MYVQNRTLPGFSECVKMSAYIAQYQLSVLLTFYNPLLKTVPLGWGLITKCQMWHHFGCSLKSYDMRRINQE